jgi:hypothetical protein
MKVPNETVESREDFFREWHRITLPILQALLSSGVYMKRKKGGQVAQAMIDQGPKWKQKGKSSRYEYGAVEHAVRLSVAFVQRGFSLADAGAPLKNRPVNGQGKAARDLQTVGS